MFIIQSDITVCNPIYMILHRVMLQCYTELCHRREEIRCVFQLHRPNQIRISKPYSQEQDRTAVIFLPIKPTPVTDIVPKAKKYVFFPIEANKFPK